MKKYFYIILSIIKLIYLVFSIILMNLLLENKKSNKEIKFSYIK